MTEFAGKFGADGPVGDGGTPLTRRELRAREQAVLAAESAPTPTPTSSLPFPSDVVAAGSSSRREARAPKRPKFQRPVGLPRGVSRPRTRLAVQARTPVVALQRKSLRRRLLKKLMTVGAMVGAGLMMVSTTIPANAFYSGPAQAGVPVALASEVVPAEAEAELQSISVEPTADLTLERDGYTATSFREQVFLRYGNRSFAFTNNPNGSIQWPFAIAVPISDGYGYRLDPCGFCSPWHKGVDFTPGIGSNIQAIADGVVTTAEAYRWGFGNHVILEHVINGQRITSIYAHMLEGSIRVQVGQTVKVGDTLGQVGSTGESTGPHLHFEIKVDGMEVDPFEWMKANAN